MRSQRGSKPSWPRAKPKSTARGSGRETGERRSPLSPRGAKEPPRRAPRLLRGTQSHPCPRVPKPSRSLWRSLREAKRSRQRHPPPSPPPWRGTRYRCVHGSNPAWVCGTTRRDASSRAAEHGVSSPAWFAVVSGRFWGVWCRAGVTFWCGRVGVGHRITLPLVSPPCSCGEEAAARREATDPRENRPGTPPAGAWEQGPGICGARAVQGGAGCPRVPQHGCRWAGRCRSVQGRCPAWCRWASGPKKKSTRDVPRAGDVPVPASPLLTVLCLQAAPGPAPQLSPSEEAQRRLERIFTASVIRGGGGEFGDCAWPGARCWMGTLPRPRRVLSLGVCTAACGRQPRGPALGAAGWWLW